MRRIQDFVQTGLFLYLLHVSQVVFLPDWFVFDLCWGLTGFGPSGFTPWLKVALGIGGAVGLRTTWTSSIASLLALRLTPGLWSRAVRFLWCWIAIRSKMCMLRNNENTSRGSEQYMFVNWLWNLKTLHELSMGKCNHFYFNFISTYF